MESEFDEIEWYQDDEEHPCMMMHCRCKARIGSGNAFCDHCYVMWGENGRRLDYSLEEIVVWHMR